MSDEDRVVVRRSDLAAVIAGSEPTAHRPSWWWDALGRLVSAATPEAIADQARRLGMRGYRRAASEEDAGDGR